jgi:autotransporter adhesin
VLKGAVESVAIGAQSVAKESNSVSFGNDGLKRRLVNVARGRYEHDATTAAQLSDALATLGGGAGLDAGGDIVSPSYNVQGETFNTVGDALTSLDGAVVTAATRVDRVENQLRSVFQDSPGTRSDGLGQLKLAGANGMVLGNVANGLIAPGSRDAVNGGQLHAMEQRLDGRIDGLEQRADAPSEGRALAANASAPPAATEGEGNTGASGDPATASADRAGGSIASADGGGKPIPADTPTPESPTPQVDTAELEKMLARANEYTDDAIKGVEGRLDKMDKRFNRMAAMSSAQTAMAMNTAGLATYNRLGAGVGYAEGESAMAVGYQRVLNEKGSATFSLNGAFTNSGEQSVGLGVGIGW